MCSDYKTLCYSRSVVNYLRMTRLLTLKSKLIISLTTQNHLFNWNGLTEWTWVVDPHLTSYWCNPRDMCTESATMIKIFCQLFANPRTLRNVHMSVKIHTKCKGKLKVLYYLRNKNFDNSISSTSAKTRR